MQLRNRSRIVLTGLTAAGLVALAPAAVASGPETTTTHFKNVTETFIDTGPDCEGSGLFEITVTYNGVSKESFFDDGRVHATFTQAGTFTAVSLEGGMDASGHFAVWGGFNANKQNVNGTFTFNINGTWEDGSKLSAHSVEHFNTTPGGVEFFWTKCHSS